MTRGSTAATSVHRSAAGSGRRTNLALLVLLVAAFVTGVAMYAVGSGWNAWATIAHGAVTIVALGVSPWKAALSRRSVRRRGLRPSTPALLLAGTVLVTVASGFGHRAGARELPQGLLVMQVHVGAAIGAAALAWWHIVTRPVAPRRTDLDRRALLGAAAGVAVATAATAVLPQAYGRPTRSLERGSGRPSRMPVTQWFNDKIPVVDADQWRLRVGDRPWSIEELASLGASSWTVALDCTGGWYAEQLWQGVRLDTLLAASGVAISRDGGGGSIHVRSLTGYGRRFPLPDAAHLMVATAIAGAPLSPGHGAPGRLVAPNRRGYWWVKWISAIDVDDRPWFLQPPFPLT